MADRDHEHEDQEHEDEQLEMFSREETRGRASYDPS